ncbi:hypothetical protein SBA2_260058 [Acidobacteriia bacterium SbA2]|nr:hypothetical protein SBA2_260058 [Acidobacteriia bacterium SbA2]
MVCPSADKCRLTSNQSEFAIFLGFRAVCVRNVCQNSADLTVGRGVPKSLFPALSTDTEKTPLAESCAPH